MDKKASLQMIALFLVELIIFLPLYTASALTVSDINVTGVTASSSKVSWKTDQHATGLVRYGPTENLGYTVTHSNFLQDHNLFLTGLNSETKYYFDVSSFNVTGDLVRDNNSGQFYTFTTLDITPPKQIAGLKVENTTINSAFIAWSKANEPDLSYYNIYRDRIRIGNTTKTNFQDINLQHSTLYSYKISAVDLSGNEGPLSDTVIAQTLTPDLKAPIISSLQITEVTDTTATISWITDENSTSIIYFGLSQALNNFKEDKLFAINHAVTIQQLEKGKEYSFIASSCDSDNNCANSTKQNLIAGRDVTAPPLNITIPEFVNAKTIDIIGLTEPFSEIKLYVNNLNLPVRFLDSPKTPSGAFEFLNIALEKENVIKLTARDKAGNGNEKIFRVSVDTENPNIVLGDIPAVTIRKNISIIGTVNEPVSISIFLSENANTSIPEKITGLNATVRNNSIVLTWNKSDARHFSNYIIYRNDAGAIAATDSASYNTFTDLLVNSGFTYTYQVSAVTVFGKESPKSEPATVKIPAGSKKGIPKPEAISILQEAKKERLSINTTGSFSTSIQLGNDGLYSLIIEFADRAKNKVVIEKEIVLDTKLPEIKITSPPKGTSIYENYANEVDIDGITEPNAEVHLFVQRTPLGFLNKTFDVSGLPNAIENIPENKLRADCRLALGATQFCSTGADFSTTADNEGRFFFEDVDLTSIISGAISITQEPLTEFTQDEELKESRKSSLILIATDKSGLRNAIRADFNIVTCWSGNQTWDIIPLTEFQSPPLVSTERLTEGNEHIFFYFNYTYHGRGSDGIIENVEISKACKGSELLGENRFNVSCRILPEGATSTKVNPDGKVSYTAIRLNKLPNMDRFLEDDWKDFFKQLGTEITFPLRVRITYKHKVGGRDATEVQTTCQEVSYLVDNSRIDPRKVLPDWLLFDTVDLLDDAVKELTKVKKEIDRVLEYVVVGCVSSFLLRGVAQIIRRWVTFWEEKKFALRTLINIDQIQFSSAKEGDKDYCKQVAQNIVRDYKLSNFKGLKLQYFSDKDLKRCFPDIASAWDTEANLYKAYRFTCDRVFGHKTPSRWTETRSDEELSTKLQTAEGCAIDQSAQGQPLRAISCREVAARFKPAINPDRFNLDEKCFEFFDKDGRQATLYQLGEQVSGAENIYRISYVSGPSRREIQYAVKQTDTQFITTQPKTCAEICSITPGRTPSDQKILESRATVTKGGGTYTSTTSNPGAQWACIQSSQCKALSKNPQNVEGIKVTSSVPRGYSEDCFYQTTASYAPSETQSPNSVSDKPDLRFECCCLNAIKAPPTKYYQFTDANLYQSPDGNNNAFEDKNNPGQTATTFENMKWSYRYWKEKYQARGSDGALHIEYNPSRYIEGRDFPACFGQNNWLYDGWSGPEKDPGNLLIIDPAKQHESAFQCVNIAGINNRITLLTNLMTQLSGCFKQIRTTGTADAGVCKELFTQYVCSALWNIIQYFTNACLPFGTGYDFSKSDDDVVQYISGGVKSVWGAVADSQQELMQEYGNAKLENLLGAGEEAVARKVCLAAFGYDWEINLQDVVDAAYAQSFASLVTAPTGTREFLTIDPQSGQAKYEYRASWIINPGCEMENYRVELACVGRNQIDKYKGINCKSVHDPGGNNCDCKNLPDEKTQSFFSSRGKLVQNVVENRDHHDVIDSLYRYDHLKFILRPDRRIKGDLKDACFPDGYYENGQGIFYFPLRDRTPKDIVSCQADITSGLFKCGGAQSFWDSKGTAYFISEKINEEVVGRKEIAVKSGEPLYFQPTIYKSPGPNQCLIVDIRTGSSTVRKVVNVDLDGPQAYPPIQLIPTTELNRGVRPRIEFLDCGGSSGTRSCTEILRDKRLTIDVLSRINAQEIDIELRFEDVDHDGGRTGEIDLNANSQDKLIVDGEDKILGIGGWWDNEQRAAIVDLSDKGVKFKIRSVGYDKSISFVRYNINIPAATGVASDERWTLTYALYHIKGNNTDCTNFNPSELITYQGTQQRKTQIVTVTTKAVSADKPKIDFKVDSRVQLKQDEDLELRADITDNKEVNEKIIYTLSRPDNSVFTDTSICSQASPEAGIGDKKQCTVKVSQSSLNNLAGTYKIEVRAKDSDNNEESNSRAFEVACVSNGYDSYGICQRAGDRCERGTIDDTALNCAPNFQCCKFK